MDEGQDNANKASGGSAAGAQGIFSTPELTVDTEKIAQNNTNNEKKRVASIFANTDAGQRSQKLNNAMGVSSQPITEDLVIQNEPKKKSKLPIILVVVVLIAVVGGLVGWIVMRNGGGQATVTNATIEEARQKFDEFATYILFGKSENNLSGEYDSSTTYELSRQASSSNYDADFWNKASASLETAVTTYNSVKDKQDTSLLSYLQNYQKDLEFLKLYTELDDVSEEQLYRSYSQSGTDTAKEYVDNFYNKYLTDEMSALGRSILEHRQQQFKYYVDVLDAYNAQGCLVDQGKLNDDCMLQKNDLSTAEQAISYMDNARLEAHNSTQLLTRNLIRDCWTISERFVHPLRVEEEISE